MNYAIVIVLRAILVIKSEFIKIEQNRSEFNLPCYQSVRINGMTS